MKALSTQQNINKIANGPKDVGTSDFKLVGWKTTKMVWFLRGHFALAAM